MHNQTCRENHLGLWAVEPVWFQQAVSAVRAGVWQPQAAAVQERTDRPAYNRMDNVAVIPVHDFMMKGQSKFGGTSTVATRKAIRDANRDENVSAILLHIDSPGGHHFGTDELAAEVRNSRLPVVSYIEDTGASAAYWTAAAAGKGRVFANRAGEIGSIGTFAVLEDISGAVEADGVKVHVVSTGAYKGAGVPGTPISDELLSEVRVAVDRAFSFFADSVKADRKLSDEKFEAVADGRMFGAADAQKKGLIDGIMTIDEALTRASELGASYAAKRRVTGYQRKVAMEALDRFRC